MRWGAEEASRAGPDELARSAASQRALYLPVLRDLDRPTCAYEPWPSACLSGPPWREWLPSANRCLARLPFCGSSARWLAEGCREFLERFYRAFPIA